MIKCDPHGPLVVHVAKLYAESDGQSFAAFGRIYSGTVKPGEYSSLAIEIFPSAILILTQAIGRRPSQSSR
jgi:translation elongation factor EF-G